MNKRLFIVVIVCIVIGFAFTGCSLEETLNDILEQIEEVDLDEIIETDAAVTTTSVSDSDGWASPDSDDEEDTDTDTETKEEVDIVVEIEGIDIEDATVSKVIERIDFDALYNEEDKGEEQDLANRLGYWLKYEVEDLDYEGMDNYLYNLSFITSATFEEISSYYFCILHGSEDFDMDRYHPDYSSSIGAVDGCLAGGTLCGMWTVIEINEYSDYIYISIFCRTERYY